MKVKTGSFMLVLYYQGVLSGFGAPWAISRVSTLKTSVGGHMTHSLFEDQEWQTVQCMEAIITTQKSDYMMKGSCCVGLSSE